MIHDARIDNPHMTDGKSDPVNVFTDNGQLDVAYFCDDGFWHTKDGDSFGNVLWWVEIEFPRNWKCDWSQFGEEKPSPIIEKINKESLVSAYLETGITQGVI